MNTVILTGGLVVLGIYFINRSVPSFKDTSFGREMEFAKSIPVAVTTEKIQKEVSYYDQETGTYKTDTREVPKLEAVHYETCGDDSNCQSNALIGATTRCYGSLCRPMVSSETLGIMYSPIELGTPERCGRHYLLGQGESCQKDSDCSTSGIICDPTQKSCKFSGMTSKSYCSNEGKCSRKVGPWWGMYWKKEDISESTYDSLRKEDFSGENKIQHELLSRNFRCPELKNMN